MKDGLFLFKVGVILLSFSCLFCWIFGRNPKAETEIVVLSWEKAAGFLPFRSRPGISSFPYIATTGGSGWFEKEGLVESSKP